MIPLPVIISPKKSPAAKPSTFQAKTAYFLYLQPFWYLKNSQHLVNFWHIKTICCVSYMNYITAKEKSWQEKKLPNISQNSLWNSRQFLVLTRYCGQITFFLIGENHAMDYWKNASNLGRAVDRADTVIIRTKI